MDEKEFIKQLIGARKASADSAMLCVCEKVRCQECPYFGSNHCSFAIINDLLDYIINNKLEHQETNLEHYRDSIFGVLNDDTYNAYQNSDYDHMSDWLLAPYEEPKPKYKLTQFEYDLLDTFDCLDKGMRFDGYYQLMAMKERDYFSCVSEEATIFDIIENAEVVNNG